MSEERQRGVIDHLTEVAPYEVSPVMSAVYFTE